MIDATRWHSQYIYGKKPAWFLLIITLPHTHFVDVADNLVERESKKIEETVSKQEKLCLCANRW
jgi:hypothetical protein